jgi:inosose dehydratase
MTDTVRYPQLHLGTAPDSWGVWNPGLDPLQTPWTRYLDEARVAGYAYSELGPYGYLPTDPGVVRAEYEQRGLTLTGGTVLVALHKGREALVQAKADCDAEMATIGPSGARHLVILPDGYTDIDGNLTASPTLTDDEWTALTTGMSELGRYVADEHGAVLVFHSHADSHVGSQEQITRFLDDTDPRHVSLCLDTGHVSYCGGDSLAIIRDYPDRIQYVHLKQVDPVIRQRAVDERLGFATAVRLGVMVEPPTGDPDMPEVIAALAGLGRELFCIVEQDLYPCDPAVPLPIATRTREYFEALGLDIGRQPAARG